MKAIVLEKLLDFIASNFQVEKEDINSEQSLIDEGIIDSFGLVEIAGFINSEFGLVIDEEEMNSDNFGSVVKIVDFICRKTGE